MGGIYQAAAGPSLLPVGRRDARRAMESALLALLDRQLAAEGAGAGGPAAHELSEDEEGEGAGSEDGAGPLG